MINYIKVCAAYDPMSQETLDEIVQKIQGIASAIQVTEDKGKAVFWMIMSLLGLGLLFAGMPSGADHKQHG